jgi:hypothetical protein
MSRLRRASTFRIASSAARTASENFTTGSGNGYATPVGISGVRIYIETTAAGTSPSTVFSIQVRDPLNDQWHSLISSAAITATGRATLEVYPGAGAVSNIVSGRSIGKGFRVAAAHGNSTSHTYNIVGEWLP